MQKINAGVIGDPIKHSLSPKLHNYWLEKYNISGSYNAYHIKSTELEDFLLNLRGNSLIGVNVTLPHKENAYKIIKRYGVTSKIADEIKAVNTVFLKKNTLFATSTDYYGFKESLFKSFSNFSLNNKKILLLGAGGAAKSVIYGILKEEIRSLKVINRTISKLYDIKSDLNEKITIGNLDNIEDDIESSDIIINATSCGLNNKNNIDINYSNITEKKLFYDMVYNPLETFFLQQAKKNNHDIVTGIGMLIYQAAPAFQSFFKFMPKTTKEDQKYLLNYKKD